MTTPNTAAGRALLNDGHDILRHAYTPCSGDCWLGHGILAIEAEARAEAELERDQQERFKWRANERADRAEAGLNDALALLVANNIHGGLANGYCAVCQGPCLRALLDKGGEK